MISGLGVLSGSLASGYVGQWCLRESTGLIDYHQFWLVPAGMGLVVAVILALFFREARPVPTADA